MGAHQASYGDVRLDLRLERISRANAIQAASTVRS
jgi:hypothetical protein